MTTCLSDSLWCLDCLLKGFCPDRQQDKPNQWNVVGDDSDSEDTNEFVKKLDNLQRLGGGRAHDSNMNGLQVQRDSYSKEQQQDGRLTV